MAKGTQQNEIRKARELMAEAVIKAEERAIEIKLNAVGELMARQRDKESK